MHLAQEFEQLWDSADAPPDVLGFLQQQTTVDSDQWLAVLLSDQKRRWLTDNPLQVEDYLAGLPDLPEDVDWKLQLAIGEFEARRDTERPLSQDEISSRFADIGDTLRENLFPASLDQTTVFTNDESPVNSPVQKPQPFEQICDDFEQAWGRDEARPVLKQFLKNCHPEDYENLLRELIHIELWWRRRKQERPEYSDYESQFPKHAELFQEFLNQPQVSGNDEEQRFREAPTYLGGDAAAQAVGRYRLLRVLGEGAFGRVYLGLDEELQRQVAIKVPTAERFRKPEDAEQYLEEARNVARLDHPNIVPVYDTGRTDDGSIYVVSKFIEGGTLGDRIRDDRPGHRESAGLLVTIALALHHAHERRLIHRDIKPANLLIQEQTNTPYVADFGLAIREEDILKKNAFAGTPAYMSPEQAAGEGHRLDGRSDVFSLGVVLYELLTGKKGHAI